MEKKVVNKKKPEKKLLNKKKPEKKLLNKKSEKKSEKKPQKKIVNKKKMKGGENGNTNNSFPIKDIEYDSEKITFILKNGNKYTLKNNHAISIPEANMIDYPITIISDSIILKLIIGVSYRLNLNNIMITGLGDDKKKSFLNNLKNPDGEKEKIMNKIFVDWIVKNANDPFNVIFTRENFHYNTQKIIDYINGGNNRASITDKFGNLPIHLALHYESYIDLIIFLLKKYPNSVICKNNLGEIPLHVAAKTNCSNYLINILIDMNINTLRFKDNNGCIPLHIAIISEENGINNNVLQKIRLLIDKDINTLTTPNKNGNLPIHLAVVNNVSLKKIELLVNKNKEILIIKNNNGNLPLHLATISATNAEVQIARANVALANGNIYNISNIKNSNYYLQVITLLVDKKNETVAYRNNDKKYPYQLYYRNSTLIHYYKMNQNIMNILKKNLVFYKRFIW